MFTEANLIGDRGVAVIRELSPRTYAFDFSVFLKNPLRIFLELRIL